MDEVYQYLLKFNLLHVFRGPYYGPCVTRGIYHLEGKGVSGRTS